MCEWFDGLYMANETSMYDYLTKDQINDLSKYIVDMYGTDLPLDELNESIYLVLENVPGTEVLSTQKIQSLIIQIRNQYYDENRCKK